MNCKESYNCFCMHAVSIFIAPHQSFKCASLERGSPRFRMLSILSTLEAQWIPEPTSKPSCLQLHRKEGRKQASKPAMTWFCDFRVVLYLQ